MRARGSGTIINVSSTAGFFTMGDYSAIKAWVTTYTEGLSNELRGTGVQVTALCPGWVRTEFHERADISTGSIPSSLWLDADGSSRLPGRRSARPGHLHPLQALPGPDVPGPPPAPYAPSAPSPGSSPIPALTDPTPPALTSGPSFHRRPDVALTFGPSFTDGPTCPSLSAPHCRCRRRVGAFWGDWRHVLRAILR